jgi:hypothetical protein
MRRAAPEGCHVSAGVTALREVVVLLPENRGTWVERLSSTVAWGQEGEAGLSWIGERRRLEVGVEGGRRDERKGGRRRQRGRRRLAGEQAVGRLRRRTYVDLTGEAELGRRRAGRGDEASGRPLRAGTAGASYRPGRQALCNGSGVVRCRPLQSLRCGKPARATAARRSFGEGLGMPSPAVVQKNVAAREGSSETEVEALGVSAGRLRCENRGAP